MANCGLKSNDIYSPFGYINLEGIFNICWTNICDSHNSEKISSKLMYLRYADHTEHSYKGGFFKTLCVTHCISMYFRFMSYYPGLCI